MDHDTWNEVEPAPDAPMQPLLSPTSLRTPTNAMSLVVLQRKLEERPEHVSGVDPYLQKIFNAAQQAFAERELLKEENQELVKQNDEKKTRQHVEERNIGEAKVMAYEDIVEALKARDRKEADREKKKASKQTTKNISKPQAAKKKRTTASEAELGLREVESAGLSACCSVFAVDRPAILHD